MNLTENVFKHFDKVSFELTDELKEVLYKELKEAQDYSSPYHLSIRTEYSIFHERLDNYFKIKGFKKHPSKTDYLAWILLLTYPKEKIISFKAFNDMNLEFIKLTNSSNRVTSSEDINSDFEIINEEEVDEDTLTHRTCICSQTIENIYKLKNKFTDITFQVGCDCIKRHGLVSKEELCKNTERLKIKKERKKEIDEGLSIGYYEKLRRADKELKLKQKMEREFNKNLRLQEKLMKREKKQQQEEEKLMALEDSYIKRINSVSHYKNCILCKKGGLYSKYCKLIICYNCVPSSIRVKNNLINDEIFKKKREYKEEECLNCEILIIYRYKGIIKRFCMSCEKKFKILKCKLCPNEFMDNINSTDILCNICDEKSKFCIDCNHKFMQENNFIKRCGLCQYRFIYKIKIKICQECEDEFEVKENENWKTYCGDCFKDSLCSVKCPDCGLTFKKLPNQEWRKTCTDCYYKSKNRSTTYSLS